MLKIQNLSKCFGDLQVLRDVNINVKKGEVVVVIGPSGSGKSTMLRCLNLLEKPTGGHILYKEQDITHFGKKVTDYRKEVGMVFQRFNLFSLKTVLENVAMAPVQLNHLSRDEAKNRQWSFLRR